MILVLKGVLSLGWQMGSERAFREQRHVRRAVWLELSQSCLQRVGRQMGTKVVRIRKARQKSLDFIQ